MTSQEYWRQREEAHAAAEALTEEEISREMNMNFALMLNEVQTEINNFYAKYASSNGLTMAEAQQKVSQFDVQAFQEKAKEYVENKDFSKEANTQLRVYNLTMKINRLEMLKAQIGLDLVAGYDQIESFMEDELYQKAMREHARQAGILGTTVMEPKDLKREMMGIVNAPFKNATWHNRLWAQQSELADAVSGLVTNSIIQGTGPRELARRLVQRFGIDPETGRKTKGAAYDAVRLMRTETARVQTDVQMSSLKDGGFEDFVFITVGTSACDICKEIDGKHFKVSEMEISVNAPPMHPNCRCSTAAWMDRAALEKELGIELPKVEEAQKEKEPEPLDITEGGKYKRVDLEPYKNKDELKAKYKEFITPYYESQGISEIEHDILWDKKNGYIQAQKSYKAINGHFRGDPSVILSESQYKTCDTLEKLCSENQLFADLITYRKVDLNYIQTFLGVNVGRKYSFTNPSARDNIIAEINSNLGNNRIKPVPDSAVTSVSLVESLNYFDMRPVFIEIQTPKGTKGIITDNYEESEFIAQRNSKLRFLGAEAYDYIDDSGHVKHLIRLLARIEQDG